MIRIEPQNSLPNPIQDRVPVRLCYLDLGSSEVVLEGSLQTGSVGLESVLGSDSLLDLLIFVAGDGDLNLFAGGLVDRRNAEDSVGVEVEGDFDLRNSSRSRRESCEVDDSESIIVLGHRAFSFEYLNCDGGLVVGVRRENLSLSSRNS